MDEINRESKYKKWKNAVERALNWGHYTREKFPLDKLM